MKRVPIAAKILIPFVLLTTILLAQAVLTSNDAVLSGQQSVTATAANLGTTGIKTICVIAAHGNGSAVYVGGSNVTTANGGILNADQSWCANVKNLGAVYVVGNGNTVSWIATK